MPDHFTDENEGEPVAWRSRRRGSDDDWDLFFTKPATILWRWLSASPTLPTG